jgi:hypothetical protein
MIHFFSWFYGTSLHDVILVCERYTIAVTKEYEYQEQGYQAIGTIIQAPHESSSVKGCSRSSNRKRFRNKDENTTPLSSNRRNPNRTATKLPTCTDMRCQFSLKLGTDNNWYLAETGTMACYMLTYRLQYRQHCTVHTLSAPIFHFLAVFSPTAFESNMNISKNPLDYRTVGSVSGLSTTGASILLRFHTGMGIT